MISLELDSIQAFTVYRAYILYIEKRFKYHFRDLRDIGTSASFILKDQLDELMNEKRILLELVELIQEGRKIKLDIMEIDYIIEGLYIEFQKSFEMASSEILKCVLYEEKQKIIDKFNYDHEHFTFLIKQFQEAYHMEGIEISCKNPVKSDHNKDERIKELEEILKSR